MKELKWNEQRIEVQRCAMALRKMNEAGKEIPAEVFSKMGETLSAEEIEAIETYLMYVSVGGKGADYLTMEEMNEKIDRSVPGIVEI